MSEEGKTPGLDRDLLAAFVDGALSPEDAAAVVMHLADHPQDQAHVDNLIAANEALAAAFSTPLHEPVPEAIRAAILGHAPADDGRSRVVPFRPRGRVSVWIGGALALAASVAAVAVLTTGSPGPDTGGLLTVGPIDDGSALGRAVAGLPSLAPAPLDDGKEMMILATLRTADGRFCREVEIIDRAAARIDLGIACMAPEGGWAVEVAVQELLRSDEGDGFATASGSGPGSLGQFLDLQGAGDALSPEAERRAIETGWTR